MRRAAFPLLLLLGASPPDARTRLADAKREAAAASARAQALTTQAAREADAAARARRQEQALSAEVQAAAATVRAGEARLALVEQAQDEQRARLATAQEPAARLLAALTGLARRPTVAAVAQPGSLDDLVHLRAVLGAALPVVRERTAGVRAELAQTRRLAADATLAVTALREGRVALDQRRRELAAVAARRLDQARVLTRDAIAQSDRALALGEEARDLVDRMVEYDVAETRTGDLAELPGPAPRPLAPGPRPIMPTASYRLPVEGRLVIGLGEASAAGVRSRGLTLAVTPGAAVAAPAGGAIRYARRFRGYGVIVLIDHGGGWTSLVTGLARASVLPGMSVAAGVPVGIAGGGDEPQVTVELRRGGRPVDIGALL